MNKPCGCIPGEFYCPQAEKLKRAMDHAYNRKLMDEYDRLQEELDDHMRKARQRERDE